MKKSFESQKWPNFFIVGAARAGSTSLYNFLKNTEGIFMSPLKETGFFHPNNPRKLDEKAYLDLFKGAKNEKIVGEATPGYLTNPDTPKKIHQKIPNAKILISLRDPVDRTYSLYLDRVRQGLYSQPFENTVKDYFKKKNSQTVQDLEKIIRGSSYYLHVKQYLDIFGTDQVKIIIFEEFIKDPKKILKDIIEFLGLSSEPPNLEEKNNSYSQPLGNVGEYIVGNSVINNIAKLLLPKTNREKLLRTLLNKKSKKPILSQEIRNKLSTVFVGDVTKLKLLLKRDLPWEESFGS